MAQWLTESLRQPFVVENRAGAAGNIAAQAVMGSQPDGYRLLVVMAASAIYATLYPRLPFNFLRDVAHKVPLRIRTVASCAGQR